MGKREEGLELVKKGVRLDLTSHIVWHVFGLIQKGEKNYEEALKSYTQALRFDKVSPNQVLFHALQAHFCTTSSLRLAQSSGRVSILSLASSPQFNTENLVFVLESGQSEHPAGRSTSPNTASPLRRPCRHSLSSLKTATQLTAKLDWACVSVPPQRKPRGSQECIRTVRTLLKGPLCNGTTPPC